MSKINFNIEQTGTCVTDLKKYAGELEVQAQNVQSMIKTVSEQWAGTGAAEYTEYLNGLKGKISLRAGQLRELGERLDSARNAAIMADKEAAGKSGGQQSISGQTGGGQAVSGHTAGVHASGHTLDGQNAGSKGDSFTGTVTGAVAGEFDKIKNIFKEV